MFEEIGVKSTFQHVLYVRELSKYTYNSFDIYYACLMQASDKAFDSLALCQEEVETCEWIPLKDLKEFMKDRSTGTQKHLSTYLHELH